MSTQQMEPPDTPVQPGLELAYSFVLPSYDVILRRIDVAEARARANLGFAGTLMFAAPAFIAATRPNFHPLFVSPWFIFGALAFVGVYACVVIQQIPRVVGELHVITPRGVSADAWLRASPAEFRWNALRYAADNWENNRDHVNRLIDIATIGAILLGLEVACLATWVVVD
jgi:hypothetical protein